MRKKTKKTGLVSLITRDLAARGAVVLTKVRSLSLEAYRASMSNKLALLNLMVTLITLHRVLQLDERMKEISLNIMTAAVGGYINTMILFQAVAIELQRLLEIFGGDKV
jgi:hypothetical protein